MDPIEMLNIRIENIDKKFDRSVKDLYTKMESLFEKQDVKIMSLLKTKWKMKGAWVLSGFLFSGTIQIVIILLQKFGG